jgi:hydrogenase-1 operon protein HyaF
VTSVDDIGVQVEAMHGNVRPILNEVIHALDRLLEDDAPTTIDLAGLPFAPGELDELEATLGNGELVANLDALGSSCIRETTYPGVWWIEHRNVHDEVVGRYLEVTRLPEILCSQDADIMAGRARLGEEFE